MNKKEKALDYRVPRGARMQLRQISDGRWSWAVFLWKNRLAEGTEPTRPEAEKALRKALGRELVKVTKTTQERAALRAKIKNWCKTRPYAAAFFFEGLARGMSLEALMEGAEDGERGRWEDDEGQKWRPELPTHHLAKKAPAIMMSLAEACDELGWTPQKAEAFARDYFGPWYYNPGADWRSTIEVIPLKKKKREAEAEE